MKKSTRQAAQKVRSNGRLKSRMDKIPNSKSVVIGSFCCVLSPLWRRRPLMMEVIYQLLIRGLGGLLLGAWGVPHSGTVEPKKNILGKPKRRYIGPGPQGKSAQA